MTRPVGLLGEFIINSLVLFVTERLTCSAVRTKSVSSVSMKTLLARQNATICGKVTQYGFGISTSSPGFNSVHAALNKPCFPPHDAATSTEGKSVPNCSPKYEATASRNIFRPEMGVYFVM